MKQTRREFLSTTALLGAAGVLSFSPMQQLIAQISSPDKKYVPRRKNILFIAIDDLRAELACYGHPLVKSPNIDKLALQGVLFRKNYCQQAVCAPSRASLLTGKRPDTTKIYDLKTHVRTTMPDVVTLQQHFKDNGYFSVGLGKLFHIGFEDEKSYSIPHNFGGGATYLLKENLDKLNSGGKVTVDNGLNAESTGKTRMRAHATECADAPDEAYHDGALAQLAIEQLRKLAPRAKAGSKKDQQPFFLGVGFSKPHLPFCAPKKYWDLYDRNAIPLPDPNRPKDAPDIAFTNWEELRSYSDIPDIGKCDDATTRELIHGYYACISYTDAQVGKLMEELDRLDLRKDTTVVLWGDNGWKLGEYAMWCKHTNFELDTKVPLIISDPDLPQGQITDQLTELVDLYPTLSALCGLSVADDLEGSSLIPLMNNPKAAWKKAAFSQYPRPGNIMGYSIRTEQYRYNEWINLKTKNTIGIELYDLKNDPLSKESIALKSENKQLVDHLHNMLQAGWKHALPVNE